MEYWIVMTRLSTYPGKSGIFSWIFQPLEVPENQFGPGKSLKLKLKVLESTGK